jgi:hypothetical protein
VTVAPASTAFFTTASTSSTYRKTPAVVPPSSVGAFVVDCGNTSESITSESPISISAWPIRLPGASIRMRSFAPNAFL